MMDYKVPKLQYFGPPEAKSWLIWKDPDAVKDWGQEEKGTREDEMVGWHHRLNGHGFGWTLGVGDGRGGLVCCGSWGRKESDMTERLNWTEGKYNNNCHGKVFDMWSKLSITITLIITKILYTRLEGEKKNRKSLRKYPTLNSFHNFKIFLFCISMTKN